MRFRVDESGFMDSRTRIQQICLYRFPAGGRGSHFLTIFKLIEGTHPSDVESHIWEGHRLPRARVGLLFAAKEPYFGEREIEIDGDRDEEKKEIER